MARCRPWPSGNAPTGPICSSPPNVPLRQGLVQYVGDYVAFVVAETHDQARDAAELVAVEYEELPSVTATADVLSAGAPSVWEEASDNVCFVHEEGDKAAVEAAIAGAPHVTTLAVGYNPGRRGPDGAARLHRRVR